MLRYLREKRNLYVHNGGLADDHFVRYAHDFLNQTVQVGDEVPFTVPDLTTALQACLSIVFSVDAVIVQQFPQLGTIDARQFTATIGTALHTIAAGPLGQLNAQQEAEITAAFATAKSWEGMRRFAIDGALPSTDVLGVYHQQIWSAIQDGGVWFLRNLTDSENFGPFDSRANAAAHFQTLVQTDR